MAFSDIFTNILQDSDLKEIYLVVDALDEYISDKLQLLDLIGQQASAPSRVKWIVSSRNRFEIEEGLIGIKQKVRLCLELNAKSISDAVNHYINDQVEQLAKRKKYDLTIKRHVQAYLSFNSNDTFLWVALVCQNLKETHRQKVITKLKQFPLSLDSLYKRIIHELNKSEDRHLLRKTLAVIIVLWRPTTLKELEALVETPDDWPRGLQSLPEWIELYGSFVVLREKTIYFIH